MRGVWYKPAVSEPVPGVQLGEVVREDAVATVLAATDASTGEPVAVRRLHRALAADEGARLVFAEEARRVATLRHPHLLAVRRKDVDAAVPYYVTDPVTGETLESARARGLVGEDTARATVRGFLEAMRHLEGRSQFHAAPLPSRIVTVAGEWKFLTFRDVRAQDEAMRLKGKAPPDPDWAPPEIDANSGAAVHAKTLLPWSLGALWLFLRTGLVPAAAWGRLAPRPAHDTAPATKEEEMIARWMDREPLRRPSGADACLRQLDALEGPCPSRPPPSPRTAPPRPPS
jgi:eukaryotic-like serine/threonine-protein kinase